MASTSSRILNPALAQRVMSADEAAALIQPGSILGMSGFTGSGYPKAVPTALAKRITAAHESGESFKVSIFTGASTGPELDGALAKADGVNLRLPYSGDPEMRKRINNGETDYMDIHLSHVAQLVDYGFLGKMDVAITAGAVCRTLLAMPILRLATRFGWTARRRSSVARARWRRCGPG